MKRGEDGDGEIRSQNSEIVDNTVTQYPGIKIAPISTRYS
jgi:hypothetical protein